MGHCRWTKGWLQFRERHAANKNAAGKLLRTLIASGLFLTLAFAFTGSAMASTAHDLETTWGNDFKTLPTVVYDGSSGTGVVITALLNHNTSTHRWAYYAWDGTGSINVYGTLDGTQTGGFDPYVGELIQSVTGTWNPFHQIPEISGPTVTLGSGTRAVPAPPVATIDQVSNLPLLGDKPNAYVNPYAGYLVELDNVTISGQSGVFGSSTSPNGATLTDPNGNSCTFYYWPSSYSVSKANLQYQPIPTTPVNMTGFFSVYNTTQLEFTPMTIKPALGAAAIWSPANNNINNWDGSTTNFNTTAGPISDTTTWNATFDDSGNTAPFNGTVNISNVQVAQAITVSNSAGTYNFSGGNVTVTAQMNKTGAGTLLINTTLTSPINNVTAGTLGGNGTIIGNLTVGGSNGPVLTPGSPSSVGMLNVQGTVDFSSSGTYRWKYGASTDMDGTSGTAGTTWDLLNLSGGTGNVNFGGAAKLSLSFSGAANPNDGADFWNHNHTWVIAGSGGLAPTVGGTILSNSYTAGAFSLQGDASNDLVLKFTTNNAAGLSRNLLWSDGLSTTLVDTSGTWNNNNWTDGSTPGLSFDSLRADNATFGNPAGSGGTAGVTVNGVVTAGTIGFSGGNAAQYTLTGGSIIVNNGISANQSATINSNVFLGFSQTWNVASGTLAAKSGISQATVSALTKTGPGTLAIAGPATYTGGTNLNQGVISVTGDNNLPASGLFSIAAPALLALNGSSQTVGGLTGSGSIDLGMGSGTLTFGNATTQTFSGVIGGNGSITMNGAGAQTLSGSNTFSGGVNINQGELFVSNDYNLGNGANGVSITNGAMLGVTSSSLSSSRNITIGTNGVLDVAGSGNTLTLSGQISGGTLSVNIANPIGNDVPLGGTVVLTGNNNSQAATLLGGGTLSISSTGSVGSGQIAFVSAGLLPGTTGSARYRPATLQLTNSSPINLANAIQFPQSGSGNPCIDTEGAAVTLSGQLVSQKTGTIGLQKYGPGTLIIAGTDYSAYTATNFGYTGYQHEIYQGAVVVSAVMAGSHYSELGNGNINVESGATFQLANVQLGMKSDATGTTGNWIDLYNGATLLGSGTSCLMNTDVSPAVSSTAASSMTIGTVNAIDVFSLLNSVKQFGTADARNLGGNVWVSATNAATLHVTGSGTVQLQPGGLYQSGGSVRDFNTGKTAGTSTHQFAGDWSVDNNATLQLGPYYTEDDPRVTGPYHGPYGQMLNGLGFKIAANGSNYQQDPDIPNGLTVNSGGKFVVAVDQVNTLYSQTAGDLTSILSNATSTEAYGVNGTPNYLRNPITLSGGTLAVSGFEVSFGTQGIVNIGGTTSYYPLVTSTNTLVTARLGGNFAVAPSSVSTIQTYDSAGNARTVDLLGGTRVLSNSTVAYSANTTLHYTTNWAGTLNVDGGGVGGQFQLLRDTGGSATNVASGAAINIINRATVLVGDIDASAEPLGAVADPNGALFDGTNSVNFTGSGAAGQGGHLVFNRSTNLTYRGNINGNLDVTQSGSDLLVLSGDNHYTGRTLVSSGTLQIATSTALPDGNSLIVGANAATIFGTSSVGSGVAGQASVTAVPEPASLTLLLALAASLAGICWRRRAKAGC